MKPTHESLSRAVEAEVALFCEAEQIFQQQKGNLGKTYGDDSLHARSSNCGIATAFLQQALHTHHNIATERLYGEPPKAPRSEHGNRIFGHVILRHETTLIDPTYGQLFAFVGMTPQQIETVKHYYPEHLALLIGAEQRGATLSSLADSLHRASLRDHVQLQRYAPLRGVGKQTIAAALGDIYEPSHYTQHQASSADLTYDHLQEILRIANSVRR